jgi:hypothetical protein
MSNVLKLSLQETICTLDARGWSRRRIARELGIDRETVGRYLRLAKPAISIPGSEEASEGKPAISTPGNGVGRKSRESSVADKRIHGTTCKQVAACFEEEWPHRVLHPHLFQRSAKRSALAGLSKTVEKDFRRRA